MLWSRHETSRPSIEGIYYGDQIGFNDLLQPFLEQIGEQFSYVSTMGWIGGLEHSPAANHWSKRNSVTLSVNAV